MRFLDTLGLARDNLSRARMRTALTATGVAIGAAAVVTLLAFGNGVEDISVRRAASFGSLTDVNVYPATPGARGRPSNQTHALTTASLGALRHVPHVASVTTYVITPPLRVTFNGHSIDASSHAQSPLADSQTLTAGHVMAANERDGVLIPASLVPTFHVTATRLVGRAVTLTAGGSVGAGASSGGLVVIGPDRTFSAHVAGVYDDSSNAKDGATSPVLVSSSLGAAINGTLRGESGTAYLARQGYSLAAVHADDARQTANVATRIGALHYFTRSRTDLLEQVRQIFAILKGGLAAIGGIALVVAAVGIANTLIMTILERTREIGIMKALGAEPGTMRLLFLVETALVGVIGGLAGLVLAALGTVAGNLVLTRWLSAQGANTTGGSLFMLTPDLMVEAVLLAIAVSLIGGALPSRRAVRLQPLDALRYE